MTTPETAEFEYYVLAANHAMAVIAHLTGMPPEMVWASYHQALSERAESLTQQDFVLVNGG